MADVVVMATTCPGMNAKFLLKDKRKAPGEISRLLRTVAFFKGRFSFEDESIGYSIANNWWNRN
jgi:hypothetical protein